MRIKNIIWLTIAFAGCAQNNDELDSLNKAINLQFRGDFKATFQRKILEPDYLLLELKASTNHKYDCESGFPEHIVKSVFYSLTDKQRSSIDLIRISINNLDGAHTECDILINTLIKNDSIMQITYCDILPTIWNQGLGISLDEIIEPEFYRIAPDLHKASHHQMINHNDSLEFELKLNSGEKFKYADSCYFFTIDKDQKLQFCRRNNPNDNRYNEYYKLISKQDGFYIFEVSRYEAGEYVAFDPITGNAYSTIGYPKFSYSKKYMYSIGSPGGESSISIHRLSDRKSITLSFSKDWFIKEDYWINEEGVRFKLEAIQCRQGNKFIDCHFIN